MIHKHLLICKLLWVSLPLSGLLGPTIGLSWIQVPLSLVMSSFCIFFWILFVAKYIGNMNADFIHALS